MGTIVGPSDEEERVHVDFSTTAGGSLSYHLLAKDLITMTEYERRLAEIAAAAFKGRKRAVEASEKSRDEPTATDKETDSEDDTSSSEGISEGVGSGTLDANNDDTSDASDTTETVDSCFDPFMVTSDDETDGISQGANHAPESPLQRVSIIVPDVLKEIAKHRRRDVRHFLFDEQLPRF